jgi:hypothetical protein
MALLLSSNWQVRDALRRPASEVSRWPALAYRASFLRLSFAVGSFTFVM